jgi:ubiquitin-protein ligase
MLGALFGGGQVEEPPTDVSAQGSDVSGSEQPLDEATEEVMFELLQEYATYLEYERMQDLVPVGMYLLPSFDDRLIWHGTLFVHSGLYKDGIYKFMVEFPDAYPETPPKIVFTSEVFHPLVDLKTGEFQLQVFFPDWQSGRDYLSCVLPHLHKAFRRNDYLTKTVGLKLAKTVAIGGRDQTQMMDAKPFNPDALDLWQSDPGDFAKRVARYAEISREKLYQNPHKPSLNFSKGPAAAQDRILEKLKIRDPKEPLEVPTNEFADWFCDHYASARVHIEVGQDVEVVPISPRQEASGDSDDAEAPGLKEGYAPSGGWAAADSDDDDDSSDNSEDDELRLRTAVLLKQAQLRFTEALKRGNSDKKGDAAATPETK